MSAWPTKLDRRRLITLAGGAVLAGGLSAVLLPWWQGLRRPVVIASSVWPGHELMFLARSEGWLVDSGVVLLETASANASLDLLATGEADGAALTLDAMLRARAARIDLTAILVFGVSAGADVVLARAGIDTLAGLRGQRIGVEQSALGVLMLRKLLEAAGLARSDLTVVPVTSTDHQRVWRAGQVDALVTCEPVASVLQAEGGYRIFDSRGIPDTIFDVLAVRTSVLRRRPGPLRRLLLAHFRALRHLRASVQDATYRLARRLELPAAEVLSLYRGVELPQVYQNRKYLSEKNNRVLAAARTFSTLLVEEGLIPQQDDLRDLINPTLLPQEP
ncbi:MAG: ABC transporter substrate-binding protein [Magnetococcus sp. DMHC-8]